jgi:hypothetical protein
VTGVQTCALPIYILKFEENNKTKIPLMAYTVETKKSYDLYPRTKLEIIKEMMAKHLKNEILLSYTDTDNPKAAKFNQLIFKHMIENIPVPNHKDTDIFTNNYNYYQRILTTLEEYNGRP